LAPKILEDPEKYVFTKEEKSGKLRKI